MSKHLEDFSAIYGGFLTTEEQAELSKFASMLLAAKTTNNEEQIKALIKEAASTIDNYADFEAVMGVFDWLEKEASGTPSTMWGNILAGVLASAALSPLVIAGVKSGTRSKKIKESLKQIMIDYPNLKNDPNVPRYFRMIVDFAPDVAANPILAGNVLENFRKLGPAAVTPTVINELLGLQSRFSTNSTDVAKTYVDPVAKASEALVGRAGKVEELKTKEKDRALRHAAAARDLQIARARHPNLSFEDLPK